VSGLNNIINVVISETHTQTYASMRIFDLLLRRESYIKSLSFQERDFPKGMPLARVSSLNQISLKGNIFYWLISMERI